MVWPCLEDECNQPLGICVMIYWLQVIVKFAAVTGWYCWHDCPPDFGPPTFRRLIPCLYRIFAIVTVLFEVIFPVTTFIMLVLADTCTPGLIANTWFVLSPFICWIMCLRHIPIENMAMLVNTFTRIGFDPDTFNDETYAKSCAICSSDFAASTASTASTAIVSPPLCCRSPRLSRTVFGWLASKSAVMSGMSQPFGSRSWSWNGRASRRGTFICFVRAESEQSLGMLRQSSLREHYQSAHYVRFPCKSANSKAASSSLYQSCKHIAKEGDWACHCAGPWHWREDVE